jgi:AcrR family transcriptional regulator
LKSAPAVARRRLPSQARGRERVERILDAAGLELSAAGYDRTTMEAIAVRAGSSIGSVYQFFPNKPAIVEALVARYLERSKSLFDALPSPESLDRTWDEVLDGVIEAVAAFHADQPGLRAIWLGAHVSSELIEVGDAIDREFARRTGALLKAYAPSMDTPRRKLVACMSVQVLSALLLLFGDRDERARAAGIAEAKLLMRRWLGPYIERTRPSR